MAELQGTVLIEKLLFLIADIVMSVEEKKMDDGKIDWAEWSGIGIDVVPGAIALIGKSAELKAEFDDWSAEERQTNLAIFREHFDLANDKAEKIVELLLIAGVNLVEGFGLLTKKDPV